ncbi:MAG: RNA methyltransferase [Mycoplasmataceae bacterium]|jgi:TrmH family RNA methyltransferase|nr:RNA methyltransferase [Mycoplasmataceae bacterium]
MEKIVSRDNKLVKLAKKLFEDKKYRDATNLFVCESMRVVEQVIKNKIAPQNIILSSQSKYIGKFSEYKEAVIVDHRVFESISSLKNSDGVMGVFNKVKLNFELTKGNYIILDRIQNAGNLGTIIRTAVAFGIDGVVITNDSVDIYNPAIIRATMGSIFVIPIKFITSLAAAIDLFKKANFKVYASILNDKAVDIDRVNFSNKSNAMILGNEGNGIKIEDAKKCDEMVYIPINKTVDSLNVAVAAGIIIAKMK